MLRNETTGKIILEKTRHAKSFLSLFRGLMLERKSRFDYALVFHLPAETRLGASVHMLLVFFPVGIVFLNAEKIVVDKARLEPWALNYTPKKPAKYFIEMPEGKAEGISIGDRLEWG